MQQAPIKDKDFAVQISGSYDSIKFADIRQKSLKEYVDRKNKRKKEKEKITPVPEAFPGKTVVVSISEYHGKGNYYLYEVVDFVERKSHKDFKYFGILLKTTNKDALDRIGRLGSFSGTSNSWGWDLHISKLPEDKIKWLNK